MPGLAMAINEANGNQGLGSSCSDISRLSNLPTLSLRLPRKVLYCFVIEGVDFFNHS